MPGSDRYGVRVKSQVRGHVGQWRALAAAGGACL